jgi:hypothetical protein
VARDPATGPAALAAALLGDPATRDRLAADPEEVLVAFGVGDEDLPALAALVEEGARRLPPAERRASQALVFLALASRHR